MNIGRDVALRIPAVDQDGQVIDVYVSKTRDTVVVTTFFTTALTGHGEPVEVTTDKSLVLARTIRELVPVAPPRHRSLREHHDRGGLWDRSA